MSKEVGQGDEKTTKSDEALAAVGLFCKTLEKMQNNPKANWQIKDIKKVCKNLNINFSNPKRGSHCKVRSEYLDMILTIPAKRPIKPIYIKNLVYYALAHIEASAQDLGDNNA